jgi:hypothetical protein
MTCYGNYAGYNGIPSTLFVLCLLESVDDSARVTTFCT